MQRLEFDLFKPYPQIVHGIFLRHGGCSGPPFDSLNMSFSVGDQQDHVQRNRQKVQKEYRLSSLIFPKLVHGIDICRITSQHIGQNIVADALFTNEPEIGLAVTHADCQAAMFWDPEHAVIGIVHAGWRGQIQNIYQAFCHRLVKEMKTDPKQLRVCISPSLGPQHAEFINYQREFPKDLWQFKKDAFHFDLWEMARFQLMQCGILHQQIEISRICTYSHPKEYFSYRRDKGKTGRHAAIIALV